MDQTPPPPPSTSSDVRTWCVLCHAAALLGLFFHFLGHILGPLIVWLMKRGDSPGDRRLRKGIAQFPNLDADL